MELNKELRAARERTPSKDVPTECMSPREVAEAVNAWLWASTGRRYEISGNYISRIERGNVRWPNSAYRSALRHVFGVATDAELGLRNTRRSATALAPTAGRAQPAIASVDMEAMLTDAADESARFLEHAEATNVGDLTVDQMHSEVRRIASNYSKTAMVPLFTRARLLRDHSFTLLSGRQPPRHARELYATAGWSLTLLAWMSLDLDRPDAFESHARTAWACAENADHNGLRAWVRASQDAAAFWQGDYQRAAEYCADGLNYATGTAALFLTSAYASNLARSGPPEAARTAVQRAQHEAEHADGSDDDLGGLFSCSVERAEGFWSEAHFALGEPALTLEHANRAVSVFESTPEETRLYGSERMTRAQQVRAHVALGDLRSAASAFAPVLDTPPEYRVRPLVQRVSEIGQMLDTLAQTGLPAAGQELHEGVAEFNRLAAPPELSAD